MKQIIWLVVIALVIWGLSSVAGKKAAPKADTQQVVGNSEVIKFGVILPLTGDAAAYGEPALNVYKIAVDEINKAGGVDGKKIELVVEDSKCTGKDGANATQKLVNSDGLRIIIGGICSSETLASLPVIEAAGAVMASPGASSPDLTGKSKNFFRNYPSDSSQGSVLAEVLAKQGKKNVAVIAEQTDYATGITKAFKTKFESLGGKVTVEEFPTTAKDFRSQITKLKGMKADALLINGQTPASIERVVTQVSESGWKVQMALNDVAFGTPDLVTKFKKFLEGTIGAEVGVDLNNPKFKHLVDTYKALYGKDLPFQSYGQTEYDIVFILKDAIEAVGYDGNKIAAWARLVKDWNGAAGMVTIGENGDPVSGHRPEIVKDGKIIPYVQ